MRVAKYVALAFLFLFLAQGCGITPEQNNSDDGNLSTYIAPLLKGKAVKQRYIVVLKKPSTAKKMMKASGMAKLRVYRTFKDCVNGFAVTLSAKELKHVRRNRNVLYVQPDSLIKKMVQTTPTGVSRMGGTSSLSSINVGVAILDTGIQRNHPDLNVVGGINFAAGGGTADWDDNDGHGTHVAGTIGAINNTEGVIGIAPGTPLYAIRVLDDTGVGYVSDIIAGIDWVAARVSTIKVLNMSLGGSIGSSSGNCSPDGQGGFIDPGDAFHTAVCNAVAAGVTVVVAAGNDRIDACNDSPAAYPEAITVSALADFDGSPGGNRTGITYNFSNCSESKDDSFACFSNWGSCVDVMAPGVGIYSTYINSGYAFSSGTSMASPHVAGAAARYIAANPSATPAQVLAGLRKDTAPCDTTSGRCTDDLDTTQEPLILITPTAAGCNTNPNLCNDNNPCTVDTCTNNTCSNTPKNCNDNNACTNDSCNASTGQCENTSKNCNDNNACTTDSCNTSTGQCVNTAKNCDDNNACTIDTCNAANGLCVNTAKSCDDNNACTTDSCGANGQCSNVAKSCDDNNACTTDSCNTSTGQCSNVAKSCDDNNACTTDSCNASTGQCSNTPVTCPPPSACQVSVCNAATGCGTTPKNCDDGNPCTVDSCNASTGQCSNTPKNCNDNNACTTDSCNASTGQCANAAITCPAAPACQVAVCQPSVGCTTVPKNCDDGRSCTTDSCNPATNACVNDESGCNVCKARNERCSRKNECCSRRCRRVRLNGTRVKVCR